MTGRIFHFFAMVFCLTLVFTVSTGLSLSPATRNYVVKRTAMPVLADGRLDEPAWQKAERIRFEAKNGGPPKQATTAMMVWDDKFLYIAFQCEDNDVWSTLTQRDDPLYNEEVVEVFIDADSDGETYVEYEINPLGVLFDGYILNRRGDRDLILAWESKKVRWGVQVAGTLGDLSDTDTGWTVEYAIPLAEIVTGPHTPPRPGDKWRLNLYRIDRPRGKQDTPSEGSLWSPVSGSTFHDPDCFGEIEFSSDPVR
ncbi:MAG: carbohydrate-binding family 9-like protein [Gemmatimonadota bacterium]|nr:carbohydrate-binding family 9-like protein [Gemmatimonadota bacterium]